MRARVVVIVTGAAAAIASGACNSGDEHDTTPVNPGTYGIVRDLKTGAIVVRGPGGGGCDCDEDFNHARWFPPDSFEIAVAHSNSGGGWQRFSGKASASRVHVDTLSDEPDWH